MGRLSKLKRENIEMANKRLLGEQQTGLEKGVDVVKDTGKKLIGKGKDLMTNLKDAQQTKKQLVSALGVCSGANICEPKDLQDMSTKKTQIIAKHLKKMGYNQVYSGKGITSLIPEKENGIGCAILNNQRKEKAMQTLNVDGERNRYTFDDGSKLDPITSQTGNMIKWSPLRYNKKMLFTNGDTHVFFFLGEWEPVVSGPHSGVPTPKYN